MLLYPQQPAAGSNYFQNPHFNQHSQAPNGAPPWGSEQYPKAPYNGATGYPTAPPSPPYYYPPAPQQQVFYPPQPQAWPGTPTSEAPPALPMQNMQRPPQPMPQQTMQHSMQDQQNVGTMQGGAGPTYGDEGNDVYIVLVGNLEWKVKWQELKDLVRTFTGKIERAEVYTHEDGRSKGFGYVSIRGKDATMTVIDRLDGMEHKGRMLSARLGSLSEAGNPSFLRPVKKGDGTEQPGVGVIPVPYLPAEYVDSNAMQVLLGENPTPLDLASTQHSIAMQAYLHFSAKASNSAARAQFELSLASKARTSRNWSRAFDSERAASLHEEARLKAHHQAMTAYQLASEHLESANKMRIQAGLPLLALNGDPLPSQPTAMPTYHTQAPPAQPMYPTVMNDTTQPHYSMAPSAASMQAPIYVPHGASGGLPVNITFGAVATEPRGVFIGNLPYHTSWMELKDYLRRAGKILRCDVPHSADGKPRGYAVALFATPAEAQTAVRMFNDVGFNGRPLRVRLDRFCETKNPGARRERMESRDEDDTSTVVAGESANEEEGKI